MKKFQLFIFLIIIIIFERLFIDDKKEQDKKIFRHCFQFSLLPIIGFYFSYNIIHSNFIYFNANDSEINNRTIECLDQAYVLFRKFYKFLAIQKRAHPQVF